MIIVLGTNALVQIFGAKSPYYALQKSILNGQVVLSYSTGILLEYEEILTRYGGSARWNRVWRVLEITGQIHNNLRQIEPAFQWRLIRADPEDNKFVDCAIAAEAQWIVTEDGHYSVLKASGHKPSRLRQKHLFVKCCQRFQ